MTAPTKEEMEILKQFREKVADLNLEKESDLRMLRWLRARELNISQSEEMLRHHSKWRDEENISKVLEWVPPSEFKVDYHYEIVGRDNKGHPICLIPFGVWDVRKVLKSGTRQLWFRYVDMIIAQIYVKLKETSIEFNDEITQCVIVMNFDKFSMKQLSSFANVNTIMELVRRFEANYPEFLYKFYIINASRLFQLLFALVKPVISPRTLAKLDIYTTQDKWQPVFNANLPVDTLPFEFGGNRQNGLDATLETMDIGDVESHGVLVTVNIPAGEKLELQYAVTKVNTIIKWKFVTAAYDIGFSIYDDKKDAVLSNKRYDTQTTDSLTCQKIGEYFLTFDNTYSKLREKIVYYNIEVLDPDS